MQSSLQRRVGLFVSPKADEFEGAVQRTLPKVGIEVELIGRQNGAAVRYDRCDLLLFTGPMRSHFGEIEALARVVKEGQQPVPPVVFWFTEQVPHPNSSPLVTKVAAKLRYRAGGVQNRPLPGGRLRAVGEVLKLQAVVPDLTVHTFSDSNTRFLGKLGVRAVTTPWGYHERMGKVVQPDLGQRPIDVLFLGNPDSRRGLLIQQLAPELERRRIRFEGSKRNIYVEERTQFLNQAKMMLCIGRQPWDDHVIRMLYGGANGLLNVVEQTAESSPVQGPFQADRDFVMARVKELPDLIADYLADPQKMAAVAEQGHQTALANPLEGQISRFLCT
jgi:hypothetical protein